MQTFSYTNPGSTEHMLVIMEPTLTFVKLTCGGSVAMEMRFTIEGALLGEPVGTLVNLFESQGVVGESLHARLKLIYLDRTQTMLRDCTNTKSRME